MNKPFLVGLCYVLTNKKPAASAGRWLRWFKAFAPAVHCEVLNSMFELLVIKKHLHFCYNHTVSIFNYIRYTIQYKHIMFHNLIIVWGPFLVFLPSNWSGLKTFASQVLTWMSWRRAVRPATATSSNAARCALANRRPSSKRSKSWRRRRRWKVVEVATGCFETKDGRPSTWIKQERIW